MSRVFFEILSLSRVFLSRVSSGGGREGPGEQGQLSRLSRVFSEIPILSRVMLSRVSSKGRGNYDPKDGQGMAEGWPMDGRGMAEDRGHPLHPNKTPPVLCSTFP